MRYTLAPGASESWSPTLKAQKRRTSFEEGKTSESSDSIYSASCNLRIGTVKYKQGKFPMVPQNSHDLPKFPQSQKIPMVPKNFQSQNSHSPLPHIELTI